MVEDAPTKETEGFHILRGPDGSVYMISDANLDRHRVSEEVIPALIEAYGSQQKASGRPAREMGSFKILVRGEIDRKASDLAPIDTWVDTM